MPHRDDPRAHHPIPEMLLNEIRVRFGLSFRTFQHGQGLRGLTGRAKLSDAAPDARTYVWHSHNATAVSLWAARMAAASARAAVRI